jgi:uncharacterized protein YqgC (DUF456 family)
MTIDRPAIAATGASTAAVHRVPALPSWRWLRWALLLAGAAQLITISALTRFDPVPATWSALLLAVAPAPLAAAAGFAPAPSNRLALAAAVVAIIVGGVVQITHTGLFFVPALVALVAGGGMLWRERPSAPGGRRR